MYQTGSDQAQQQPGRRQQEQSEDILKKLNQDTGKTLSGRLLGSGLRNRVNPTWMKGMTTQHPLYPQPEASQGAVHLNRLTGIVGAGGIITAVITQKGAQQITITLDQPDKQLFHSNTANQYKPLLIITALPLIGQERNSFFFAETTETML